MQRENCICGKLSTNYCGGCKGKRYCSVECQKQDWKNHKKECKDYKISDHEYEFYYNRGCNLDYNFKEKKDMKPCDKQRFEALKAGEIIKKEKIEVLKKWVKMLTTNFKYVNGMVNH